MREILFRGKDYEGNWVEGDLINKADDGTFIGFDIEENFHSETTYWYKEVLVDPETIGQFTGLLDKNGNKIFEGDVVLLFKNKWLVVWENDRYLLRFKNSTRPFFMDIHLSEIIGNIHDNPELLEDEWGNE